MVGLYSVVMMGDTRVNTDKWPLKSERLFFSRTPVLRGEKAEGFVDTRESIEIEDIGGVTMAQENSHVAPMEYGDIANQVFGYLTIDDLVALARTCKLCKERVYKMPSTKDVMRVFQSVMDPLECPTREWQVSRIIDETQLGLLEDYWEHSEPNRTAVFAYVRRSGPVHFHFHKWKAALIRLKESSPSSFVFVNNPTICAFLSCVRSPRSPHTIDELFDLVDFYNNEDITADYCLLDHVIFQRGKTEFAGIDKYIAWCYGRVARSDSLEAFTEKFYLEGISHARASERLLSRDFRYRPEMGSFDAYIRFSACHEMIHDVIDNSDYTRSELAEIINNAPLYPGNAGTPLDYIPIPCYFSGRARVYIMTYTVDEFRRFGHDPHSLMASREEVSKIMNLIIELDKADWLEIALTHWVMTPQDYGSVLHNHIRVAIVRTAHKCFNILLAIATLMDYAPSVRAFDNLGREEEPIDKHIRKMYDLGTAELPRSPIFDQIRTILLKQAAAYEMELQADAPVDDPSNTYTGYFRSSKRHRTE